MINNHFSQVLESVVELSYHYGSRALLRPINTGRALRPAQRIGHVTRDLKCHILDSLVKCPHIDASEVPQRSTALKDFLAAAVEKASPKCSCHARAAIIGGASSYANENMFHTKIQCGTYQLTRPTGRCDHWIALPRLQEGQPTRCSHLYYCGGTVATNT